MVDTFLLDDADNQQDVANAFHLLKPRCFWFNLFAWFLNSDVKKVLSRPLFNFNYYALYGLDGIMVDGAKFNGHNSGSHFKRLPLLVRF